MKWQTLLVYLCLAFALFLGYDIAHRIYSQEYQLMDIVGDIGVILICVDLALSSYFLHLTQKAKPPAEKKRVLLQKSVKISRKVGHFGIMLIVCSWIVPLL